MSKELTMPETDFKLVEKNVDENLKVLRTIYAVLYVVGFREVLTAIDLKGGILNGLPLAFLASAVALVALAIRMFWGVGNIRRHTGEMLVRYEALHPGQGFASASKGIFKGPQGFLIMVFDVPVLLTHSFLFYLLCKLQPLILGGADQLVNTRQFIAVLSTLLGLNALWLATLKLRKSGAPPQTFWFFNNLCFAGTLTGLWRISSPSLSECQLFSGPTLMWLAVGVCLLNSVLDLCFTAWAYLVGTYSHALDL
jgi:hypothetical protein